MTKSIYLSPSMQENNIGVAGYGTEEFRMNQVSDVVERILKRHGITVYRNKPDWTLQKVAQDSNSKKPNLHFAIHSNAGGGRSGEIYAYAPGGEGEKAARAIYSELEPITPSADRGVKFWPELYELRKTSAPAVLVEIAFHDNEDDAKWIIANIEKIGAALAKGVLKYFGIEFVSETYELEQAVKVLKEKGVITDLDYWIGNAVPGRIVRGEFAGILIRRAALLLKGGS